MGMSINTDTLPIGSISAGMLTANIVDWSKIQPALFNPFPAPDGSEGDIPAKDRSGKELPQAWLLLAKDIAGKNLDELRHTWEGICASDEAFPTTDWMRHPLLRKWFFQIHDFEYGRA